MLTTNATRRSTLSLLLMRRFGFVFKRRVGGIRQRESNRATCTNPELADYLINSTSDT